LDGLNDLGWGEWAAIAKKYVPSKTSSQVGDYAYRHHQNYESKAKSGRTRKPWTDEEKSALLDGLNDLGWGEWAAIAKKYVPSKTSSQVCDYAHNHAKKYVPSKNWRLVSHCARREIAKGGTEGARRPANGRRESQEEEADFSEEDEMFFVEHILQRKMFEVQGKMVERCLVKWSGYSSEHNSWEPLENVAHILETHPAVDQATKE